MQFSLLYSLSTTSRTRVLGLAGLILICVMFFSVPLSAARYALVIGSNYKGNAAGIPKLDLCEKDASLMKRTLMLNGKYTDMQVLLGRMVTAKNLEKAIDRLAARVGKKDTVVLFFAGHGTVVRDVNAPNKMRNYIVMYDRPHVPDNTLNEWLNKINTTKLVWIFDCCHSGGIARKGRKSRGGNKPIPVAKGKAGTVIENANKSRSYYFQDKAIVGSSAGNETAIEIRGSVNQGLFTYYFAKGVLPRNGDMNRDGSVTVYEAFEWSRKRVADHAKKKFNHNQHPQISGQASGIILAGRDTPIPPAPKPDPKPNPNVPDLPEPGPDVDNDDSIEDTENEEPEVVEHKVKGRVTFLTTIFEWSQAGPKPTDALTLLRRSRRGNERRKVAVRIGNDIQDTRIQWLSEAQLRRETGESIKLGWFIYKGRRYYNKVAKITVNNVPTGVHEFTILADGYPMIQRRLGVERDSKKNKLFVLASVSGHGSIQGKIYYKNFETPLAGQKIWMPTVRTTNQKHTAISKRDGSFWFLNLPPGGGYLIRASLLENLDKDELTILSGKVTTVDVVLNRRLRK